MSIEEQDENDGSPPEGVEINIAQKCRRKPPQVDREARISKSLSTVRVRAQSCD